MTRRSWLLAGGGLVLAAVAAGVIVVASGWLVEGDGGVRWNMDASVIEASSCPMFGEHWVGAPRAESAPTACRFTRAFHVNRGKYGEVGLEGATFWMAGELQADPARGGGSWAVVTFDGATSAAQRGGIGAVLAQLYPGPWSSLTTAEGAIEWTDLDNTVNLRPRSEDYAHATLDGGRTAEIRLERPAHAEDPAQQVVLQNLRYWGAGSNDGFVVMPCVKQAWHGGGTPFEERDSNGFTITIHVESKRADTPAG
ncbi:MAG: DUF1326 domain-containing protein [Deltaproteobacteria bacterium]|nr:DUF1326 domain-containing protein [Deltaproteobacteria bacterium]